MLYVANITKNDLNRPKLLEDFKLSPMGADSGKPQLVELDVRIFRRRPAAIEHDVCCNAALQRDRNLVWNVNVGHLD